MLPWPCLPSPAADGGADEEGASDGLPKGFRLTRGSCSERGCRGQASYPDSFMGAQTLDVLKESLRGPGYSSPAARWLCQVAASGNNVASINVKAALEVSFRGDVTTVVIHGLVRNELGVPDSEP